MIKIRAVLLGLASAFLCSCASVSVDHLQGTTSAVPKTPPKQIIVQPFAVDAAGVKENSMRKNPGQLASDTQKLLAAYTAAELTKAGLPASVGTTARGAETWIVRGRLTRLAEGSRFLRMGLGLGMGGTKMETTVEVMRAGATAPFLQFATSGGSNAVPGAATNPIPFSAAPQALLNSKDGVTDDSARTARMITGTIADYAAKHGLLKPGTASPKPKYRAP